MFLKNWYRAIAVIASYKAVPYTTHTGGSKATHASDLSQLQVGRETAGVSVPSVYHVQKAYNGNGGVVFGTGTTPPTIDDYKLSGDLITTINCTVSVEKGFDDTGAVINAWYAVTNTGSEKITIGEIGLMCSLYSTSSTADDKGFIERTVLDKPITIEPGGIGYIAYPIRFDLPAA
jgi:hypothetical protein